MSSKRKAALTLVASLLGAGAVGGLAIHGCGHQLSAAAGRTADGPQLYTKYCATCHGPQGFGYAADNAPSLRSETFLLSATDAFIRDGITRGRPGTAMAAYGRELGGPLAREEVTALVTFLRKGGPRRLTLPPHPATGDAKAGKVVYDSLCARCHGTPTQRSSAVHLANPILLATATDAFLRFAVEEGRPPTSMVSWKPTLATKQIDDVVAYVRSLAVPPPPAASPAPEAREPRTGPIVLNPGGKAPQFTLKEDRYVSIDEVKRALDEKRRLIITDARAPSDYHSLHITGAISTPYYDHGALDDLPNDGTWVLAYCACPHHVSGEVVDELRKRGYKHTAVIDEGVFAWQQKKYPVVQAPNMLPPPAPPPLHPIVPGQQIAPARRIVPPPLPQPPAQAVGGIVKPR